MKNSKKIMLLNLFISFMFVTSISAAVKGDVNGLNGVDIADAILSLKVCAGMQVDGVNIHADVNNDSKIGIEEAIYALKAVSTPLEGNAAIPAGLVYTDINVTNMFSETDLDENGDFVIEKEEFIYAVNRSNNNELVYICYPSTNMKPQLNAKETAISLMLQVLPIWMSSGDINTDALKEIIYFIPEVQTLEEAIQDTVDQHGMLITTEFLTEYDAAIDALIFEFGLLTRAESDQVNRKSKRSTNYIIPSEYPVFRRGIKIEKERVRQPTAGNFYEIDFSVFSQAPLYLGMTYGTRTDGGGFKIKDNSPYHFISPMNTSAFLKTFTTREGLVNYFSDSYNVAFTDMALAEATYDSKKSYILNFKIACCSEVVVFTTNTDEAKIANCIYFIVNGVNLAKSGKDSNFVNEMVKDMITDPDLIRQYKYYSEKNDYKYFIYEVLATKIGDYLAGKYEEFLLNAFSVNAFDVVMKKAKLTAKGLDVATFPIFYSRERSDFAFDLCSKPFEDKPFISFSPDIIHIGIFNNPVMLGDAAEIKIKYCYPCGLDDSGQIKLYIEDGSGASITTYTFPTNSQGELHYLLDTNIFSSAGEYTIKANIMIDGNIMFSPESVKLNILNPAVKQPIVSNLEIPAEIIAGSDLNIRFQYDDPDGVDDIAEFKILTTDPSQPSYWLPGVADSGKQFDFYIIMGDYLRFNNAGIYRVEVYAVDKNSLESEHLVKEITVLSPPDIDNDGDGYSENQGDCNDADPSIHPAAEEICWDNIDNNCNGMIDEGCIVPVPGIPSGLTAFEDPGQVTLNWESVNNTSFYNVYQGNVPGVNRIVYDLKKTVIGTSAVMNNLSGGTTYYFVVTAASFAGESNISNEVFATPSLASPANVKSVAGNESITVSWNPVSGAVSYNIFMAEEPGVTKTNYLSLAGGSKYTGMNSPFELLGLTNGTNYYFRVTALNETGESAESAEVSATPSETPSGDFTNSLGMDFKLIPAGTFMMGSPTDELGRDSDEILHQVTLTQDFYIMTTEVTQGQWTAVMGSNPSYFTACGDDCPVEYVSWNDVQEFITAMNQRGEGTYRLPTEAEWEYAARAGSTTAFYNGGGSDPNMDVIGWYYYNSAVSYTPNSSGKGTHPVAQKQPNAWGLYDMSGNVWEWCQDWYGTYPSSAVTDPTGPSTGSARVLRGGSWNCNARNCRSADRGDYYPSNRGDYGGFRLAFSPGR